MSKNLLSLKETFETKIATLDKAKIQLKKEFVGIDDTIDEVVENVRSWFTLGHLQSKPCVVNLWGLTGVGKSSLLLRLSQLLDISDKTFRIDLGEKMGKYSLNESLKEISDVSRDEPLVIILDEIQHARTLVGLTKKEIEEDPNRIIWELIDSGRITVNHWNFQIKSLINFMQFLVVLVNDGMRIRNGKVITKKKNFEKEVGDFLPNRNDYSETSMKEKLAVPECFYRLILKNIDEHYNLKYLDDIEAYLKTMDEGETLQFLHRVIRKGQQPRTKYFEKALIFVVGNVDEAYRFNGNFSADISADEFHELSKKINVPIIKYALRQRFRDEQIARLGNTHIIYPALDKKAYQDLIRLSLDNYFNQFEKEFNICWIYDETLVDKIYREGVYPTQGARPVFTTIQQIVKAKIALLFHSILIKEKHVDCIKLTVEDEELVGSFYNAKKLLWKDEHKIVSQLDTLRQPKKDERQAITAVHESGHAVLNAALMKNAPQCITSVSSDSDNEGFMFSRNKTNYTPKHELIKLVAVKLGGLVAEQLIFGEQHVTLGSSSDIQSIQSYLDFAFKESGMGEKPYSYANHTQDKTRRVHSIRSVEQEIKNIIDEGKLLAEKTLQREKKVLIKLAQKLSQKARVEQDEFIELFDKYAVGEVDFNEEPTYYRDRIENALLEISDKSSIANHRALILNKHKGSSNNKYLNSSSKSKNSYNKTE